MIKRIRGYISSPSVPMYNRVFTMTSLAAVFVLSGIFIWDIFIGEIFLKLLALGFALVAIVVCVVLAFKTGRISLFATFMCYGVIFFVLPIEFFTGGGVYGCTPIWFAYAFLFISLVKPGKSKIAYLVMLVIVAITCYIVAYLKPGVMHMHDAKVAYLDSIASLIGVGVVLVITVGFLMGIYNAEKVRAEKQAIEIDEMSKAQSHFFSSMSHEIRTPINTIIGLNEMILREDVSDEVVEDSRSIQVASRMLLHLINDILDMSKLESGKMELTTSAYNTGDMLSEIVGMLWGRAKDKGLDFHVNISPELPGELSGDEMRIKQILINVLNNAIKYTSKGSITLTIQCGKRENDILNVIYSVTDTGMGIKRENIPYLFTAFKRVDKDKNRYIEGTGLGLSIVKQLVDLMGGKITVNSVYTKGSTFIIEIPQTVIDEGVIGDYSLREKSGETDREEYVVSFTAPDARVLVVDDNVSNQMVVTKLLRDTQVTIDTADSGRDALAMTLERKYDVIFMDHMMPEMDGIECMHEIHNQKGGLCKNTRIVVLTANAESESQELYAREGFDGYLIKPITGREIEKELYRQLPDALVVRSANSDEILEESMAWMHVGVEKKPIMITTESVADLPIEFVKKYDIGVLPHMVITDQGVFEDGVEIESAGLISYISNMENHAKTAAPSVEEHVAFFADKLQKTNNIIHISISSRVENSGCIPATEAAATFENVTVIDSGHLSSGQGLMVIEAAQMVEQGYGVTEIVDRLKSMVNRIHTSFIVDDINYLARAGQINQKVASVAGAFMVHPQIQLSRGKMIASKYFLGTRDAVWDSYMSDVLRKMKNADERLLFVTYVGLTYRELEMIREKISAVRHFDRIIFQKASPAIAVNSGPGTFGLLYIDKERK